MRQSLLLAALVLLAGYSPGQAPDPRDQATVERVARERAEALAKLDQVRARNAAKKKSHEAAALEYQKAAKEYEALLVPYEKDKREHDAAKALDFTARNFKTEESLARRYRDLLKNYPGTLAAKEAFGRLGGAAPKAVPIPPAPKEPEAPVAPRPPAYEPEPVVPEVPTLSQARDQRLANEFAAKRKASANVGEIGALPTWRVGSKGRCDYTPLIVQVIPPDRVLVAHSPVSEVSVMLKVQSVAGLVDGKRFSFGRNIVHVTGTTTYPTVNGGTRTALLAEVLPP